jgi:hypothetical protein
MRNAEWWAAGLATLLIVGLAVVAWADSPAERAEKLAKLSVEEKEELLRKKERFDDLKPEEQDRLRKLHESLESKPDAEQLSTVMKNYANWLKGLQPTQRSEVLSMPADARIEAIKKIVGEQEKQRFLDFAQLFLPPEDQAQIHQWLDDFVATNEKEIMDAFQYDERRRFREIKDDRARRKALILRIGYRRPDSIPFPSQEEIEQMTTKLTETTRKELEKPSTEEERSERARRLVYAAIGSIAIPPASEEELRKFYATMPADKRAELEKLDDGHLQRELRKRYRMEKFREQAGWRGGPPRGGGRGPGGGPPPSPDSNRQPPGFANPAPKGK